VTHWDDRASRYAEAADRARQRGDLEAFADLIVVARACACIERQIAKEERRLAGLIDRAQ
jgi:hypothetical protein